MMKNKIVVLLLLAPALLWAQLDRSIRPTAGPAPTINIKNSEVFKTENGITVILSENHKIPKVSFDLVMGADPVLEGSKAGLSELTGGLILSGTSKRDKDKLDGEIDYIGARIRADENSIFMSVLTKYVDKGLDLMSDVLLNANFPTSEFDRVVKQAESGLKATKSEPSAMAQNAAARANFEKMHPYSEVMTEESLKNIKRDDVVNFYKAIFTPKGSYLVVVGDITLEETKKMVEKYFSNWNGGPAYKNDQLKAKKAEGSQVFFVKKPGAVQSVIDVTFPMDIKPGDEDQIAVSVLNNLLGGAGFSSRLMQNLREDKAFTYGCRSSVDMDENGTIFSASGNFRNEVSDSAITEILYEINAIMDAEALDDELNLIKSSMAGSFARSLENPQTVARFALNVTKYNLDKNYYSNYLKKLAAVSKDDVLLMAQKYLSAKNVNIIVVGNEDIKSKLLPFDKDGKIENLDPFGNKVVETKPADITADELIMKYSLATANAINLKKANKKLKKIKNYIRVTDLSTAQIPVPLKLTEVWMNPNKEASKMEAQGMVLQKSYFDGKSGAMTAMQVGKTEMEADEVASKAKSIGLFPEMNYKMSGMTYEIKGIEIVDGQEMYVLSLNDGKKQNLDYFHKTTFLKMKTISTQEQAGEVVTTEMSYSDYREVNGVMMPYGLTLNVGPMVLDGKVSSLEFNQKIDLEIYK